MNNENSNHETEQQPLLPNEYALVWIDEKGEVQVGTRGERFNEQTLPDIFKVAIAKLLMKRQLREWHLSAYGLDSVLLP